MDKQLIKLTGIIVGSFGLMGAFFLNTATNSSSLVTESARHNGLVAGIVCLLLATGILIFAISKFKNDSGTPGEK